MLAQLLPDEPEVDGLLALMELTAARFPARVGPDGALVLLEDQDRRRWDRPAIARGQAALARAAVGGRGLGPYGLQAAIASCPAAAQSVDQTDWGTIVVLYEALGRIAPSLVVDLNRAVAVSMAHGPQTALAIVDDLVTGDRLAGSHLLPSVRESSRPGSAAPRRPAMNSSSPPSSARTNASEIFYEQKRTPSADFGRFA